MEDAVILGCETPTEAMIAEAIHDAECDAFNDYAFTLPEKWHKHCLRIKERMQQLKHGDADEIL